MEQFWRPENTKLGQCCPLGCRSINHPGVFGQLEAAPKYLNNTLLQVCCFLVIWYCPQSKKPGDAVQIATRNEYEKVIQETESAYIKILESSQTLLTVLKRESVNIQKKRQASS